MQPTIDAKDIVDPQQGGDPRLVPSPQVVGDGTIPTMEMERVLPRQQSTGLSRGIQQLGSPNVYVDAGNEQIIVQKTVPQVLMGNQAAFGEGFYVTKPGIDVTTAKQLSDFIFNSSQNMFKIVKEMDITIEPYTTVTANAGEVANNQVGFVKRHELPFIPAVIAYIDYSPGDGTHTFFPLPLSVNTIVSDNIRYGLSSYQVATDNEVVGVIVNDFLSAIGSASGLALQFADPYDVKIYLLQESAN